MTTTRNTIFSTTDFMVALQILVGPNLIQIAFIYVYVSKRSLNILRKFLIFLAGTGIFGFLELDCTRDLETLAILLLP